MKTYFSSVFSPAFPSAFFARRVMLAALACLSGCAEPSSPDLDPLPPVEDNAHAAPRVDGQITGTSPAGSGYALYGRGGTAGSSAFTASGEGGGSYSLNFAGTDIRAAIEEILGKLLQVNYVVDPAVQGTATLHSVQPLRRDQLLPTLRALLAGANASLIRQDGLYRVIPNTNGGAKAEITVPLRYANAEGLAKILQPTVQNGGHITADPASNTIIVDGDPITRQTLTELVRSFDIDALAGQSYLLLPANTGTATELSQALQNALGAKRSGESATDAIRVLAMPSIDSILVVARQPRLLDDARRAFSVIESGRRRTVRTWSVFYLQNGRANDVAYVLQQAFTPGHVTAMPTPSVQPSAGMAASNGSGGFGNMGSNSSGLGLGSGLSGSSQSGLNSASPGGLQTSLQTPGTNQANTAAASSQPSDIANNPLLAGLGNLGQGNSSEPQIRIIPDMQNNSMLVYGTFAETDMVSAMLRKIDIMPVQVRVDATVAEVTLNDSLQYGTQFFFKSGGINGILSNASQTLGSANLSASQLASGFPGFVIGGSGQGGAPFVINTLQSVTKVRVLSSPELLVVDNQPASLMVGDLVPYLTGATTSILTANSTITNSINYQPTGVILQVTPHVSNTGLVTLDISQQVSSVSSTSTATGSGSSNNINSPTFSQRQVVSRVAIADGQTVGLAGLITDHSERGNEGIPWLKDIPIIGMLGSQQTNTRNRTELLVLITPHVIHSQNQAQMMTEDLRRSLSHAAIVAPELNATPASGSNNPQHRVLHSVGLRD